MLQPGGQGPGKGFGNATVWVSQAWTLAWPCQASLPRAPIPLGGTEALGRPGFESSPLPRCVTLGGLLNLSGPLIPPSISWFVMMVNAESSWHRTWDEVTVQVMAFVTPALVTQQQQPRHHRHIATTSGTQAT